MKRVRVILRTEIISNEKLKEWFSNILGTIIGVAGMMIGLAAILYLAMGTIFLITQAVAFYFPKYCNDGPQYLSTSDLGPWGMEKMDTLDRYFRGQPIKEEDAFWLECNPATRRLGVKEQSVENQAVIAIMMWRHFRIDVFDKEKMFRFLHHKEGEFLLPIVCGKRLVSPKT